MRIDRPLIIRGLDLVSVSDINRIVVRKDGSVCHHSPDRTAFVYGNLEVGQLDEDWALPDIQLFIRMLKTFTSTDVEITRSRNSFIMRADGVEWSYRLGSVDVIQTLEPSQVESLLATMSVKCSVAVDTLKKICGIQSVVKAAYIHFVSKEGKFKVVVGEKDTYAGSTPLEVNPDRDFDVKVPAEKFVELVGKLDCPSLELQFCLEERKVLRLAMPNFSWLLGCVKGA